MSTYLLHLQSLKGTLGLKNTFSNSEEVDIDKVFHCNGLLLCFTKNSRLVVWNPCLGETRWIHPKTGYNISRFALGYEENKFCRSYKILISWWDCYKPNPHAEVEIYEFSSDSWRVVLDDVDMDFSILENIGASLKGNTYYLAFDKLGYVFHHLVIMVTWIYQLLEKQNNSQC